MNDKSHLLRFGYAPGNYWFVCSDCGDKQAVGDKRATRCYACAETLYSQVSSVEAVADKHRAMTTLPEEAVTAATAIIRAHDNEAWGEDCGDEPYADLVTRMLTAALPFLPVQGAVKKLEWRDGYNDSQCTIIQADTVGGFYQVRQVDGLIWLDSIGHQTIYPTVEAAKAAAQADYEARILSALEPSAARELALEEHLQAIEQQLAVNLGYFHDEKRFLLETLQAHITARIAAIRALSSPDHADADKVEGDGWRPIESAPKDGTEFLGYDASTKTTHVTFVNSNGYFHDPDSHYYSEAPEFKPTHWRPLPTPPSGEVA